MKAREKAEELYFKYKEALNIRHDMRIGANPFAKQCALIAVDEISKALHKADTAYDLIEYISYWEQVKQEIKEL